MEDRCCFDRGCKCAILSGKKSCDGCKFYKTQKQFEYAEKQAKKILAEKGYVRRYYDGIVSVQLMQSRESVEEDE